VDGSRDLIDDNDPAMAVIPLEGVVTWTLDVSESIKPYIGAGAGYYMKDVDVEKDNFWKDAKDCVGYFALAGVEIHLGGPAVLFGEAKYNLISEDDEWQWRSSDVKEKYSLDGLSVNVGVKFGF
jgi:outer membrane protein W